MSFYSKELYQDVGQRWKGRGLLYLLFALTVLWIPDLKQLQDQIEYYLTIDAASIIRQMPVITITKGKVSIDRPSPVLVKYPTPDSVLMVIDTSRKLTTLDQANAEVLLTDTQLIFRVRPGETTIYDIPKDINHLVIDQPQLRRWTDALKESAIVLIAPIALLFSLLYRTVQTMLYTLLGNVFARQHQMVLPFSTIMRLAAVSLTPVLVLETIHDLIGANMPLWWMICFAVGVSYLYFGVQANVESQTPRTDA